jgi:hypothetical protein
VPTVPARDRSLAVAVLSPAQLAAFRRMTPADQRHAVRVARAILAEGACDPDLLVAALLHDIGKVDPAGRGRVRLPHRVAKVLLGRLAPGLLRRLGTTRRRGPAHGLYLLADHPAIGAAWAARLGVSPRACALIAAHQDGRLRIADCGLRIGEGPCLLELLRLLRNADDLN